MNVIVTGTWYISEKMRGHELLQSFLWYCKITAQLPLHLFIYHNSCTYCLTDKKDHMFYPMFNKFQHRDFFHSVPGIVCIDVILQYFTLYTFYRVHWIPWHMSVSFITFSFLQKSRFIRNNDVFLFKWECIWYSKYIASKKWKTCNDSNFMIDYM